MGFLGSFLKTSLASLRTLGGKPLVTGLGARALKAGHALSPGAIAFQTGLAIVPAFIGHGSLSHKVGTAGFNLLTFGMTMGMGSVIKQGLWNSAFMAIPAMPHIMRSLVTTYRSGLDARTSAAIPFSHSTLPMDQAFASFQYANQSISGMQANTASFMAARYMSRG